MAENALLKTWNGLTMRQQVVAIGATMATIVLFWFFVTMATKEPEALLYSGLEPSVAGEVAAQLDGLGVSYTLKGSAMYVPSSQRDKLRIEMARQGLPAASGVGYELLDDLNGFSTTSDMFDAAYWRAKEGELTRTILEMPSIRSARVHLGVTRQSAFRRASTQKTASVTIETRSDLTREQAQSIQYLTALAVADLNPTNVAVIDTRQGVIAGPGARDSAMGSLESSDRESKLENAILSMLEAHVGMGNARVTVAMDIDRQSTAQTERLIDPNTREIVSRNITEESEKVDRQALGGAITVASNLPDGDVAAGPEADDPNTIRAKREEEVTYTGTEIERITQTAAGTVRRLSVAVLLNERMVTAGDGSVTPSPRSEQELDTIRALVASAAGIDVARGDVVTVSTLPFEPVVIDGEMATATFVDTYVLPRALEIGQLVFLGIMTLILGMFVVKPILTAGAQGDDDEDATPKEIPLPQDAAELLTMLAEENPEDAAAILDAWFEEEQSAA